MSTINIEQFEKIVEFNIDNNINGIHNKSDPTMTTKQLLDSFFIRYCLLLSDISPQNFIIFISPYIN